MLWNKTKSFQVEAFDSENELEAAVSEVAVALFGPHRVYLNAKKKIGPKGGTRNIPDGYLIDLTSARDPQLYVVELELARHDPLKHIAVQVLEFSLSFETTPTTVKKVIRAALSEQSGAMRQCQEYAAAHGHENVDVLLERMIYGDGRFKALVIIDESSQELETVLISRFKFPVELVTLQRFTGQKGERLYQFEPFLADLSPAGPASPEDQIVDPSDIDTIVVPAREDGFQETFLGENCWYQIRIHSSMIPRIKHIAAYRVAPESAITHMAPVRSIEQYKDTNKYILSFAAPAQHIGPIRLVQGGKVRAPQAPRYTSHDRLMSAKTLDEAF